MSEEDRATATGYMHKKFGEVEPCGFRDMRADRQTYILIAILHTPLWGEVITQKRIEILNITELQSD